MTETIIAAVGAALFTGGIVGWVAFNIGHQVGHADGYLEGWRHHEATIEPRPQRGSDGRFKPRAQA